MNLGTGLYKQWHPNGVLSCQFPMVNDRDHGVSYMWSENGSLNYVFFHINGRKVTKKKYLEACEKDLTLPRLNTVTLASDDPVEQELTEWKIRQAERKANKAAPENSTSLQAFEEIIHAPATKEARKWLKSKSPPERLLGKMGSTENSLEFIEEGYAAGIKRIYAIDIKLVNDGEFETSRNLVLELPKSKRKRITAFDWIVQTCDQHSGNDPPDDDGQPYVYIFLD